jgi:hypothetical protein
VILVKEEVNTYRKKGIEGYKLVVMKQQQQVGYPTNT